MQLHLKFVVPEDRFA